MDTQESPTSTPGVTQAPQLAMLDLFFPGFSVFSGVLMRYLHIDLNLYIPMVLLAGGTVFAWRYFSEYFWSELESHFMSTVDVRTDDEAYNMLMAWVANQRFAQGARRFVVNTNLSSRSWFIWRWSDNDDDDDDESSDGGVCRRESKKLSYTPTFGSHYFWYKGRLLIFRRSQNRDQASHLVASEREEVSVACFGRSPWILKELLHDARRQYNQRDEKKTVIYRGSTKAGSTEPTWQRCMSRTSRPFSTVILNEKVKKELIDDITDYLTPATRRWYANRGIPYRRGYLLYGPPGTGKSSLSLALAGFFKMRIYIVSLSSITANEENLASLFAELPRRCVVLLEDIDAAGLTNTRDDNNDRQAASSEAAGGGGADDMVEGQVTRGLPPPPPNNPASGRLSLSGLLNILDGVASQEGRVLIMTTNHLEKLDKALIRPGRVDMIVKFDKADREMIAAIYKAIFAPLDGDEPAAVSTTSTTAVTAASGLLSASDQATDDEKKAAEDAAKRAAIMARINAQAEQFADKIPAHEFSPAELQGFLLKNKRDPDGALAGAQQWVVDTRREKKEKELREAEEKRKAEEAEKKKKKEEEEKKNEEEEKKKKEEEKKKQEEEEEEKKKKRKEKKKEEVKRKRKGKGKRKEKEDSSGSEEDTSDSEPEPAEDAPKKKEAAAAAAADDAKPAGTKVEREEGAKTESGDGRDGRLAVAEGKGVDSGYGTP